MPGDSRSVLRVLNIALRGLRVGGRRFRLIRELILSGELYYDGEAWCVGAERHATIEDALLAYPRRVDTATELELQRRYKVEFLAACEALGIRPQAYYKARVAALQAIAARAELGEEQLRTEAKTAWAREAGSDG